MVGVCIRRCNSRRLVSVLPKNDCNFCITKNLQTYLVTILSDFCGKVNAPLKNNLGYEMARSLVAATSLLVLGMLAIPLQRMQQVLPDEPYMDEVYHIKQAQAYCSSIYGQWDNKITTYPGLYLLSSGLHHLLGRIGGSQLIGSTCSV